MKKRVIYLGILFISVCFVGLFYINHTIFINNQKTVYDNTSKVLNTTLSNSKQDLVTISSTLSQTQLLKDAIKEQKSGIADEFLEQMNKNLHLNFQSDKVYIQVLTKDFIYCASNTEKYLKEHFAHYFNKNLKSIKHSRNSVVDINVRNHLNIKATTPITQGEELLGFIEVVSLYDILVQNMRKHKIELIPLLNKKWITKEYIPRKNPVVADEFIVANANYNQLLLKKLQTLLPNDMEALFLNDYLYKNDFFYALFDIKNNRGVALGKYVAILNNQGFEYMSDSQTSFLENIVTINNSAEDFYNFVKHKEENMFMNVEKGYIKNLKDVVDERDKKEFEEVARQKLLNLSKEELVDFIMQQSKHSEIRGKIQ